MTFDTFTLPLTRIHQKKLFEISRDLDIADVHQLLLNKNETEDEDAMIKEKL